MSDYSYVVHVDTVGPGNASVAYLDDPNSPLRAQGATPLEAVAALVQALMAWRHGPSDAWLYGTLEGHALRKELVSGYRPGQS